MKNITLSASEQLIRSAREKARREKTTLNALFRKWLAHYAGQGKHAPQYDELMRRLTYANPGRKFSRDDLNER